LQQQLLDSGEHVQALLPSHLHSSQLQFLQLQDLFSQAIEPI